MKRLIITFLFILVGALTFSQNESSFVFCNEKTEMLVHCIVYKVVETMPEFPGGMKALQKYILDSMNFSSIAEEQMIGSIFITFIIDDKGNVRNPCIHNTANRGFNASMETCNL